MTSMINVIVTVVAGWLLFLILISFSLLSFDTAKLRDFCSTFSPLPFYAPNFEKVGDILVSACPYVRTYVRTYSCSRYRLESLCMDSSWKNSRRVFLVFPELSPLVKLRPFDKQGDEIL